MDMRYRKLRPFKQGGFAEIWLVMDETLGRVCILKEWNGMPRSLIQKEIDAMCRAAAAYFPQILDVVETVNGPAVVMEYVQGHSLRDVLEERHHLSEQEVFHLILELCRALARLHRSTPPLIYLDLKPENIIVDGDTVRLVDFGSSVQGWERMSAITGTPGYAAPEQMAGRNSNVDNRSDVYALGKLYLECLTGVKPVADQSDRLAWHEEFVRLRGRISRTSLRLAERACALEPEHRFQTTEEMASALMHTKKQKTAVKVLSFVLRILVLVCCLLCACTATPMLLALWESIGVKDAWNAVGDCLLLENVIPVVYLTVACVLEHVREKIFFLPMYMLQEDVIRTSADIDNVFGGFYGDFEVH